MSDDGTLAAEIDDAYRAADPDVAATADDAVRRRGGDPMSIVCKDPSNCDREHVGGLGGTPVHLPPDGVVVPGHFDHGVPSDAAPASPENEGSGDE